MARILQPIEYVVDIDVPEGGFALPDMYPPTLATSEVCALFFGQMNDRWLNNHIDRGHLLLDGKPIKIPRSATSDKRRWRLHDVENVAVSLADGGYISPDQYYRVLEMIRLAVESLGYRSATPVPFRKPGSKKGAKVMVFEETTDSPDTRTHTISLDGVGWEMEMTERQWQLLLQLLLPYLDKAREAGQEIQDQTAFGLQQRRQIRAWANRNGYSVGDRGRIPQNVTMAYLRRKT